MLRSDLEFQCDRFALYFNTFHPTMNFFCNLGYEIISPPFPEGILKFWRRIGRLGFIEPVVGLAHVNGKLASFKLLQGICLHNVLYTLGRHQDIPLLFVINKSKEKKQTLLPNLDFRSLWRTDCVCIGIHFSLTNSSCCKTSRSKVSFIKSINVKTP